MIKTTYNTTDWMVSKGLRGGVSKVPNESYLNDGTSIFDPVLCEIIYKWFCIENGKILDPFAGGSVRGIVANWLNYKYTGIDLSEKQLSENRIQGKDILGNKPQPNWILGNSTKINELVNDRYDLIFSCPPYFDLEIYSEDKDDLSNMDWNDFKIQYKTIITKCVELLNPDRFACFVVSDIRDKDGFYRCFPDYTKECFIEAGCMFYNDIVLVNTAGSLPIRVSGMFKNRKVGRTHQNVLIFYKGNTANIKNNFKEINFDEYLLQIENNQ